MFVHRRVWQQGERVSVSVGGSPCTLAAPRQLTALCHDACRLIRSSSWSLRRRSRARLLHRRILRVHRSATLLSRTRSRTVATSSILGTRPLCTRLPPLSTLWPHDVRTARPLSRHLAVGYSRRLVTLAAAAAARRAPCCRHRRGAGRAAVTRRHSPPPPPHPIGHLTSHHHPARVVCHPQRLFS